MALDGSPVGQTVGGLPCGLVASVHRRDHDPDFKLPVAQGVNPHSGQPTSLVSAPSPCHAVPRAVGHSQGVPSCALLSSHLGHTEALPVALRFLPAAPRRLWASPRNPCWPLRAQAGSPFPGCCPPAPASPCRAGAWPPAPKSLYPLCSLTAAAHGMSREHPVVCPVPSPSASSGLPQRWAPGRCSLRGWMDGWMLVGHTLQTGKSWVSTRDGDRGRFQ